MLHLLIVILVFAGLIVFCVTANVFISALLIGLAETAHKRAQRHTTRFYGNPGDQH